MRGASQRYPTIFRSTKVTIIPLISIRFFGAKASWRLAGTERRQIQAHFCQL